MKSNSPLSAIAIDPSHTATAAKPQPKDPIIDDRHSNNVIIPAMTSYLTMLVQIAANHIGACYTIPKNILHNAMIHTISSLAASATSTFLVGLLTNMAMTDESEKFIEKNRANYTPEQEANLRKAHRAVINDTVQTVHGTALDNTIAIAVTNEAVVALTGGNRDGGTFIAGFISGAQSTFSQSLRQRPAVTNIERYKQKPADVAHIV